MFQRCATARAVKMQRLSGSNLLCSMAQKWYVEIRGQDVSVSIMNFFNSFVFYMFFIDLWICELKRCCWLNATFSLCLRLDLKRKSPFREAAKTSAQLSSQTLKHWSCLKANENQMSQHHNFITLKIFLILSRWMRSEQLSEWSRVPVQKIKVGGEKQPNLQESRKRCKNLNTELV